MKIHCYKTSDKDAQESVKTYIYKDSYLEDIKDSLADFDDDDEEPQEIVKYGKREAIRSNSPFYHLFMKAINKIENEEIGIDDVSNRFYCPNLLKMVCK